MKFALIIFPLLLIALVQSVNAQNAFDIINESVNNEIKNTFDSANEVNNSSESGIGGNNGGSSSDSNNTDTTAAAAAATTANNDPAKTN